MNSIFNQQPQYGTFQYAQQQPPKRWTNPLTKEQEEFLKKNSPDFTLETTPEELYRSICTHKDPEKGTFTLVENEDGTFTCTKCGARFNIVQAPLEDVEKVINGAIDILQTAKLMYVDMGNESVKSYFQMIPFLEKAPKLYQIGADTMKRIAPNGNIQQNGIYGNPFGMLSNALGTPGFAMPTYGAPYGQPMQQQFNPYQNGFVGGAGYVPNAAVDPSNPFQQQPVQQGYPFGQQAQAMNPPQPAQPVQPVQAQQPAQKQEETVEVQKQFNL